MCSEFSSPMRFQVFPASVDLYTPSPNPTLRWLLFSPVPSQTTLESFGSTLTAPSENEPPSSKIGAKVLPRFSVLNKPPDALATYHTLGFFGSISTSEMRPVVMSGPMERSGSPLTIAEVSPDGDCAPTTAQVAATARLKARVRFMAAHFVISADSLRLPRYQFAWTCLRMRWS